jgi:hypothetical protein
VLHEFKHKAKSKATHVNLMNLLDLAKSNRADVHLVLAINSSFPYIRATSSRIPENFLLKAQTVLLPNDGVLPTASIFTESFEEIFPAEWYFVTKLGPQVSPFPVPIFGVNISGAPFWNPSSSLIYS